MDEVQLLAIIKNMLGNFTPNKKKNMIQTGFFSIAHLCGMKCERDEMCFTHALTKKDPNKIFNISERKPFFCYFHKSNNDSLSLICHP